MGRCKRTKYYSEQEVKAWKCTWVPTSARFVDLKGKVFTNLKVIKMHKREDPHTFWFCKCSCGNIVSASTNQLNKTKTACTDCTMKGVGDSKLKGVSYYIDLLKGKYPSYECKNSGEGKSNKQWFWYCNTCHTPFYASPSALKHAKDVICRCNPRRFTKWNASLRRQQIEGICKERGLYFLGWKDGYKGATSRVFLKCPKHPHYESTVNNLTTAVAQYGCPYCAEDRKGHTLKHSKNLIREKGLLLFNGKYSYDNFVYKCSRTPSEVFCNDCGKPFQVSYDNHINKQRGCPYEKGRNQQELYIQQISEGDIPICIKFGIAVNSKSRMDEHRRSTIYDTKPIKVYYFPDPLSCKAAEKHIKDTIPRSFLTKREFPSGNTETTSITNLDIIDTICIKFGGKIK